MAYVRSDIIPKVAEVVRKLSEDGRQPATGELVDAVVEAGICGRGVAQQILAELRKSRASSVDDVRTPTELTEPLPGDSRIFCTRSTTSIGELTKSGHQ